MEKANLRRLNFSTKGINIEITLKLTCSLLICICILYNVEEKEDTMGRIFTLFERIIIHIF